jgi:hypothetical protein
MVKERHHNSGPGGMEAGKGAESRLSVSRHLNPEWPVGVGKELGSSCSPIIPESWASEGQSWHANLAVCIMRNTLTRPHSKNGLRDAGVQWKRDFNGEPARSGAWWADTLKEVTTSIILSSAQVPTLVPHWLSPMGCTVFPIHCLNFLLGYFKLCLSWDWSNSRGEL